MMSDQVGGSTVALSNVRINPKLKHAHKRVLLEYLRSESRLSRAQWLTLVEAIDLLDKSTLILHRRRYTFREFYNRFVDERFADHFLGALTETQDLERGTLTLQASVARRICQFLDGLSGFSRRDPECQLLLVYCLYWWSAFARGYIFEISIFRDLETSGIAFAPHDVTNRRERLSPYDFIVLDLRGDIKYTTYFVSAETIGELASDFFVTRIYDAQDNRWIRVVVMTMEAWRRIDGEAKLTTLDEIASALPGPAAIEVGTRKLIVIDYEEWKGRIRAIQERGCVQDD